MPTDPAATHRSALFIDLENLVINALGLGLAIDLDPLLARLAQYGTLSVRRSFGDLDKAVRADPRLRQPVRRALMRAMVQHEDVPYLTEHKNSADVRLVVEVLSIAYQYPDIRTFILVSSDRDYLPLIAKLRELGRTVVGVGISAEATNAFYVRACDEFLYYESLFAPVPAAVTTAAVAVRAEPAGGEAPLAVLDDYCGYLAEAVAAIEQRGGRCTGGSAYALMRQLRPDLDLARPGLGTFRELARAAEERGLIVVELQPGSDFTLSRVQHRALAASASIPAAPAPAGKVTLEARYEELLRERLKCPLPSVAHRAAVYAQAAAILGSTPGGLRLNALKERIDEQLSEPDLSSSQIFKLLYSIYRRGAFRCEQTGSPYDPQIFAIGTPVDDWDRLFLIAMLTPLTATVPPLELDPERLARLLCADAERAPLIQACLDSIGR